MNAPEQCHLFCSLLMLLPSPWLFCGNFSFITVNLLKPHAEATLIAVYCPWFHMSPLFDCYFSILLLWPIALSSMWLPMKLELMSLLPVDCCFLNSLFWYCKLLTLVTVKCWCHLHCRLLMLSQLLPALLVFLLLAIQCMDLSLAWSSLVEWYFILLSQALLIVLLWPHTATAIALVTIGSLLLS